MKGDFVMEETLKLRLTELGLKEDQIAKLETEGVMTEADMVLLSADEIKSYAGCGAVVAKKIAAAFKPKEEEKPKIEATATAAAQPSMDVLPQVPDDTSFLAMLKIGGELKIGITEIIAAIRATLADKSGLYELPKIIMDRMEKFAEEQEEPCGEDFYKLQKLVTKRNYAEIFQALDIDSASVTQGKKDALLNKLRTNLWPALYEYNQQVVSWVNSYQQGVAPTAMMALAIYATGGQAGMPAGMMQQPPDTSALRDGAEGVIDKINKVFAGTGIVIARALALDANRIKEVLENSALPAQIGAANKEQMLKMLDVNVSADYVRMERSITRYALSIMEYPKVTAGQYEYAYLAALLQLGTSIPWEKLSKEDRPAGGNSFRK